MNNERRKFFPGPVYSSRALTELAIATPGARACWQNRRGQVIDVIFTEVVGSDHSSWIPEIVHREAQKERPQNVTAK
ncbi:MAG: hypothetical protein V4481_01975 [Patescibacteria group bacterium]